MSKRSVSPDKIHIWLISIWKDAQHCMSLGNCKLKQWDSITHLFKIVKIQNTDNSKCWWRCGATGTLIHHWSECKMGDFPGGTVVKNPPANVGDMGSSPGPGRSHMPWSNETCAPQLLSLCSGACEPQLLSPRATTTEARVPRACALQQERTQQWEACAPEQRVAPAHRN